MLDKVRRISVDRAIESTIASSFNRVFATINVLLILLEHLDIENRNGVFVIQYGTVSSYYLRLPHSRFALPFKAAESSGYFELK